MSEYETRPGYLSEFVSDEQSTSDAQPDDDSTDTRDCPCPDSWPVYEVTGDHIPEDFREMGDIEMWVLWNGQVKVPLAPWMTANLKATPWGSDVTYDYPETTLDQVERAAEESIVSSFGSTQLDMHDGDGEDPFADVEFAHPSDDRVDLKPAPLLLHEDPDHPDPSC